MTPLLRFRLALLVTLLLALVGGRSQDCFLAFVGALSLTWDSPLDKDAPHPLTRLYN